VLSERCPELISRVTLIAPALDMQQVHRTILGRAAGDFRGLGNGSAVSEIEGILAASPGFMSSEMVRGLEIALQSPGLLAHYWRSPDVRLFGRWAASLGEPGSQLDIESFWAVQRDLALHVQSPVQPSSVPVDVWFASDDRIVERASQEARVRATWSEPRFHTMEGAGHFTHLEEPEAFVRALSADREAFRVAPGVVNSRSTGPSPAL
jgi:pimeloyl-ACP methyl ester carboxylesterase